MPHSFRTFVAVEVAEAVRREAARLIGRLAATRAGVKWVAPDQMHFTLSFLGDVEAAQINEVCRAVAQAAATHPRLTIDVVGLGAFPDVARPRTVWLGVGDGAARLVALQQSIEAALATLGFRPEARRYTPHLTLGRVRSLPAGDRSLTDLLRRDAQFACGPSPVDEAVIFSSVLERDGPRYEVLGRAPLGATKGLA